MAKAILEFDLTEPGDVNEHYRMVKSLDLVLFLWDFDNYMRGKLKHGDLPEGGYKVLDEARKEFYDLMNQRNISLNELLQ
jgi:hypothetical protein